MAEDTGAEVRDTGPADESVATLLKQMEAATGDMDRQLQELEDKTIPETVADDGQLISEIFSRVDAGEQRLTTVEADLANVEMDMVLVEQSTSSLQAEVDELGSLLTEVQATAETSDVRLHDVETFLQGIREGEGIRIDSTPTGLRITHRPANKWTFSKASANTINVGPGIVVANLSTYTWTEAAVTVGTGGAGVYYIVASLAGAAVSLAESTKDTWPTIGALTNAAVIGAVTFDGSEITDWVQYEFSDIYTGGMILDGDSSVAGHHESLELCPTATHTHEGQIYGWENPSGRGLVTGVDIANDYAMFWDASDSTNRTLKYITISSFVDSTLVTLLPTYLDLHSVNWRHDDVIQAYEFDNPSAFPTMIADDLVLIWHDAAPGGAPYLRYASKSVFAAWLIGAGGIAHGDLSGRATDDPDGHPSLYVLMNGSSTRNAMSGVLGDSSNAASVAPNARQLLGGDWTVVGTGYDLIVEGTEAGTVGGNGALRVAGGGRFGAACYVAAELHAYDGTSSGYLANGAAGVIGVRGSYQGDLATANEAGNFTDGTNSVKLCDGSRAVLAVGYIETGVSFRVSGTQVLTSQQAAVADASGGATVDAEARTALNALLARCRTHGFIAT